MKFMSSLDAKDRRLLLWSIAVAIGLAVVIGFVMPNENNNDNPMPSTYLSGQHGARAAYESLLRSGYNIERWERPLGELAATAGPDTVVIFARPFTRETEDINAVQKIVERGGRVLATGFWGGYLLPGAESEHRKEFDFAACKLEPEGLDPLASSGEVWMVPEATWQVGNPAHRIQYSCAGQPAVVDYRLWQWPRRLVGQLHAARKRILGARRQFRPAAQFHWTPRRPSLLLGRVAPWRYSFGLELCLRTYRYALVDRLDFGVDSHRIQLQPAQRPTSRTAATSAIHAHRVP